MSIELKPMTVEEFLPWAEGKEGRWELHEGVPVMMSPEGVAHNRGKLRAATPLENALSATKLPCEVFTDGLAITIDARTTYEPDPSVVCGPRQSDETIIVSDPIIVVQVLSRAPPPSITGANSPATSRSQACSTI